MTGVDLHDFLAHVDAGNLIRGGSEHHRFMHDAAQEAFQVTVELNSHHHDPAHVRALLARLTGRPVDDSVTVFPPFHTEFGKNLHLGKNVFINLGCRFQDTGGITIGDDTLIGHGSTTHHSQPRHGPRTSRRHATRTHRHRTQRLARRQRHGRPGHHDR